MRRVLAAFAVASLIPTSASAIVKRHDVPDELYQAREGDFPALANLFLTPAGHRDCVATLIDPRWLITAKHCTEEDGIDARVQQGEVTVTFAEGREAKVLRIVRMPQEPGPAQRNDVALLELANPITDIVPIPLYVGGGELGRVVFFPGWGGTGNGLEGLGAEDGKFRVAENRIDSTFDNFLIFRFDDPRSHLGRALALEGISGPGDSGGPALMPTPQGMQVAGISSAQRVYGGSAGLYNVDEYYVRISAVREWIDKTMGAEGNQG